MTWWLLASEPAQLVPARSQMAFTFAFWFLVALVTAVPALILLYVLDQRGEIAEEATGPPPVEGAEATAGEPGRQ